MASEENIHFYKSPHTPLLCKVYDYALKSGDLLVQHKEGKDPLQCPSHHPINLPCVDSKILTSIIAARIQKYIKFTEADQTGFMMGRQRTNNIRRVLNI